MRHQWFNASTMAEVLGEELALAQSDMLYRCLEKLLAHKVMPYRNARPAIPLPVEPTAVPTPLTGSMVIS